MATKSTCKVLVGICIPMKDAITARKRQLKAGAEKKAAKPKKKAAKLVAASSVADEMQAAIDWLQDACDKQNTLAQQQWQQKKEEMEVESEVKNGEVKQESELASVKRKLQAAEARIAVLEHRDLEGDAPAVSMSIFPEEASELVEDHQPEDPAASRGDTFLGVGLPQGSNWSSILGMRNPRDVCQDAIDFCVLKIWERSVTAGLGHGDSPTREVQITGVVDDLNGVVKRAKPFAFAALDELGFTAAEVSRDFVMVQHQSHYHGRRD